MANIIEHLFSAAAFVPHGYCLLWRPDLVALHLISDLLIGLSYFCIPIAIIYFVRKRTDLQYKWIFGLFASFILACGSTHFFEMLTLWYPYYGIEGFIKAITATVSIISAIALWPTIPKALALPSPAMLHSANAQLEKEIKEKSAMAEELQRAHDVLEQRIIERTRDLQDTNEKLANEVIRRRQAQELVASREAWLRAIIETAVDGIIITNPGNIIKLCNPACERLFGYPSEELIGQNFDILISSPPLNEFPAGSRLKNGHKIGMHSDIGIYRELIGHRKDDSTFPMDMSVSKALQDAEQITVRIIRNVTDRKQAEHALEQRAAELVRSNTDLEQFGYAVSHDLQEPLRMVASYCELLRRRYAGKLDEDADRYINYASNGAKRMRMLIQDLLTYSRISTRSKAFGATNVETIFNEMLIDLKITIEANEAVLTHDPLPTVQADDTQLRSLLQNLIDNAIKYRRAEPPHVHISAKNNGEEWVFSVKDNGIGIDSQYTDRIFQIFQRLHTLDEYPGNGIGLAICKKIVERHDGRIWVESIPGIGSKFYFTLPLMRNYL